MQRHLADSALLEVEQVTDFGNGQETETARQREHAGRNIHKRVQLETYQRIREQGETHVTEGTDGLEQATEKAVVELHVGKLRKVDDGADGFEPEGKGEHGLEDSACVDVTFLRVVGEEG